MSSRRLQDVLQDVFKASSRRVCKTSCNYVFKTSWKTKKCYTEDVLKTSSKRLQYVFTKTNVCWEYCRNVKEFNSILQSHHSSLSYIKGQKQSPGSFLQKSVLRSFAKFTLKHLCRSLFFNRVAGLSLYLY